VDELVPENQFFRTDYSSMSSRSVSLMVFLFATTSIKFLTEENCNLKMKRLFLNLEKLAEGGFDPKILS